MAQDIQKVGVIGAGQMGSGIAHVCALAGYDVKLHDVSADRIKQALATINGNMARQVSKKIITEEQRQNAIAKIEAAPSMENFSDADMVIESATEQEEVKKKIYTQLCPSLKPEAILATNTSSLSITRLASATDRPEKFIGIHFMNPVPLMELVEIIRGIATGDPDLRGVQEIRHDPAQDHCGGGRFPRFHRQPHPAADDQRGDLHAL